MVHRWAAGEIRGEPVDTVGIERFGMNADDPLDWLRDGALELVKAIMQAPETESEDLGGSESSGRSAWARRQCHETSIHAVDALAASLGRTPAAAEVDWITDEIALDGIDALLSDLAVEPGRSGSATGVYPVRPDGAERGWLLGYGPGSATLTRVSTDELAAFGEGSILAGPPVEAYLSLWNRSPRPLPRGWAAWPDQYRVQWRRSDRAEERTPQSSRS